MKLVEAQALSSLASYEMLERPVPTPTATEVLIRVRACGMGYVDALVATGGYQVKPPLPFTPGQEIAGVVEAVGGDVTNLKPGDRVMTSGFGGGLAEFNCAPAHRVDKIPDLLSFNAAAGFRINYLTALHGLLDRGALTPGERVLVFGAAGGVGSAAVQLALLLKAQVIAVASSADKREFAANLGAQQQLDTEPEDWRKRLKALCDGGGPDLAFDPVCGALFEPAFRSLSWRGRHLVVGFLGDGIPKLPVNLPLMKGAALVGVDVRQFLNYQSSQAAEHLQQLFAWVAQGRLVPPVGRCFAFDDYQAAMTFALSGQGMGKTIVEMS